MTAASLPTGTSPSLSSHRHLPVAPPSLGSERPFSSLRYPFNLSYADRTLAATGHFPPEVSKNPLKTSALNIRTSNETIGT